MSTGLFLAIDQIKARLTVLENEIRPGTAESSVTEQLTELQGNVAALQAAVGAPDAPTAATPTPPAVSVS